MPMGGGQGVWIPNSYKATKNGPWNTPPPQKKKKFWSAYEDDACLTIYKKGSEGI